MARPPLSPFVPLIPRRPVAFRHSDATTLAACHGYHLEDGLQPTPYHHSSPVDAEVSRRFPESCSRAFQAPELVPEFVLVSAQCTHCGQDCDHECAPLATQPRERPHHRFPFPDLLQRFLREHGLFSLELAQTGLSLLKAHPQERAHRDGVLANIRPFAPPLSFEVPFFIEDWLR